MTDVSQLELSPSGLLPVQARMARAALGWGVRDLAAAAMVSPDTIVRFERGEPLKPRTVAALKAALEAAGVTFLADDGAGPGLRCGRLSAT